jgi:predicted ATPase
LYVLEVRLNTSLSQHAQAIAAGRSGLRQLGVTLPSRPTMLSVLWEYVAVKRRLGRRSILELNELPVLSDERVRFAIRLLMAISQPAFHVDSLLFSVILLRLMRLSLEYGLSEVSGYALASYGVILSGAFHKHQQAYQLGELADRMEDRLHVGTFSGRVDIMRAGALYPWIRPFSESVALVERSLERSRRYGDIQYEAFAGGAFGLLSLSMGLELEGSQIHVAEALRLCERRQELEMIGSVDCIAV